MAHFATLDESNIVTQVDVVANDVILDDDGNEQEQLGIDFLTALYGVGNYKQTSYNDKMRKNYGGVGFTYDASRDAFIPPKPFASWTLNESTCRWDAPITRPTDEGVDGKYYWWNEDAYQADNSTGWIGVENEFFGQDFPDLR